MSYQNVQLSKLPQNKWSVRQCSHYCYYEHEEWDSDNVGDSGSDEEVDGSCGDDNDHDGGNDGNDGMTILIQEMVVVLMLEMVMMMVVMIRDTVKQ